MAENSVHNPNISDPRSDIQTLAASALRRYGDFAPGSADGEVIRMFVEFANMVIDEIRAHPYWDGAELDYYTHQTDTRDIPDEIIVAGLLAHYSIQQNSQKASFYVPLYQRTLNRQLWHRLNGNTRIRLIPTDGGSNPNYAQTETNTVNGLPVETDE